MTPDPFMHYAVFAIFTLAVLVVASTWFRMISRHCGRHEDIHARVNDAFKRQGGTGEPPLKMRSARGRLKPCDKLREQAVAPLFPDLPRTAEELQCRLASATGVERDRILDRLTELEEESYRSMDGIDFADDNEILDNIRGR